MTRAAMTQETCDAASKCLNRNNGDPDDRADKIQTFEGMAKVNVIGALLLAQDRAALYNAKNVNITFFRYIPRTTKGIPNK